MTGSGCSARFGVAWEIVPFSSSPSGWTDWPPPCGSVPDAATLQHRTYPNYPSHPHCQQPLAIMLIVIVIFSFARSDSVRLANPARRFLVGFSRIRLDWPDFPESGWSATARALPYDQIQTPTYPPELHLSSHLPFRRLRKNPPAWTALWP